MYAKVLSASLYGLEAAKTWTEVDTENGLPAFSLVGLANQSVKEAKERIHSAVLNCGYSFPAKRITVNLSPANRKKEGSHYDLAIALGLLMSSAQLELPEGGNGTAIACFGELSLDGRVLPVEGILPMLTGLRMEGIRTAMVPDKNLSEAMLLADMDIVPVSSLSEAAEHLSGCKPVKSYRGGPAGSDGDACIVPDFADIKGQAAAKRAAQIAAAGMHGMLMIGPPGVGKSMIGKRIPGLLPPLSYEEKLDVTRIYSISGELSGGKLIGSRPFRTPHHSISAGSLVGGGSMPKPGEISLAHKGVLFLDELPEFSSHTLDMLRQPMEDGFVTINRVSGKCVYPCDFMLVAAMNPCRCGYFGDQVRQCSCSETDRRKYLSRISGPLLDRIDIHIVMERTLYKDIGDQTAPSVSTGELKKAVDTARAMQKERYENSDIDFNSELSSHMLGKYCVLDAKCTALAEAAFSRYSLSARAYYRLLRLARTIADMSGSGDIREEHLLEALSYRPSDKFFN